MNMMERVSEMLEENAGERYAHFLALNSRLVNRISLGDLASYLGITQVSLSRIRALMPFSWVLPYRWLLNTL